MDAGAALSLEDYRKAEGLTYRALAERLGWADASLARKYCLGHRRLDADEVERVCAVLGGRVSPESFHRVRLAYLNRRAEEAR